LFTRCQVSLIKLNDNAIFNITPTYDNCFAFCTSRDGQTIVYVISLKGKKIESLIKSVSELLKWKKKYSEISFFINELMD
jgi:hypothetical protein